MHRFTRTFALIGGAVMTIAATILSWHLYSSSTEAAIGTAEDFNVALTQALGNSMRARIDELKALPEYSSISPPIVDFRADIVEQLRDRKSTRLNSSHMSESRMPSSA